MGQDSKIEWTDHTFNPWMGCTKVSPACKYCYAERDMDKRLNKVAWGPSGTRVVTSESNWRKPLNWDQKAAEKGIRSRVFCASLADVFEDWSGPMNDHAGEQLYFPHNSFDSPFWIQDCQTAGDEPPVTMNDVRHRLFQLISKTPNLDWLLLTKRPDGIKEMIGSYWDHLPVPNLWLGTSVENQEQADKRIPELTECRRISPVLFLSCEPLLGPVDMDLTCKKREISCIDWVIAGGESGPEARPSNPQWFRDLRDQCHWADVPFHFKQWGEWVSVSEVEGEGVHYSFEDHRTVRRVGKKSAGRKLDGLEHNGLPKVERAS